MKEDYIQLIEPTPQLTSKKCKLLSLILRIFLGYSTFLVGIVTWYLYNYFLAGAVFLVAFIVMGIIRSKIRNSVIPQNQMEYQYTDQAIADWYVAKEICLEKTVLEE